MPAPQADAIEADFNLPTVISCNSNAAAIITGEKVAGLLCRRMRMAA